MKRAENKKSNSSPIVIDESQGLVFSSEQELYDHFARGIEHFEKEFFSQHSSQDISPADFSNYEKNLSILLEDPDEVWAEDNDVVEDEVVIYLRKMADQEVGVQGDKKALYHVALCYMTEDIPSFVYLHFPTQDQTLLNSYRRGEKVYDRAQREAPIGALDGDALNEGDELATGLYKAMMLLRSEKDLLEESFPQYYHLREETLGEADEIWRSADSMGNILVSFIRSFSEGGEDEMYYVVVTLEDMPSNSHALLFSFPTRDRSLVDRYRHGENLQADEVVQEASH